MVYDENNPDKDTAAQLKASRDRCVNLLEEMKIIREEMNFYKTEMGKKDELLSTYSNSLPNTERKNIKLPPFNAEKPRLWFSQVDTIFSLNNIHTDSLKYSLVSSQLEARIANDVEDILTSPPAENKYDKLKSELISRLSRSEDYRVRQLLSEAELGDSLPSQFLRRLKSLAGATKVDDSFMRSLWLQRLPRQAQLVLQSHSASTPLDELANIADRLLELVPAQNVFSTAHNMFPTAQNIFSSPQNVCAAAAPSAPPLSSLEKMLSSLSERLEKLETAVKNNSYSNRGRSRSRSRSQNNRSDGICYYHHKFGAEARSCRSPCKFGKKSTQSTNANGSQ